MALNIARGAGDAAGQGGYGPINQNEAAGDVEEGRTGEGNNRPVFFSRQNSHFDKDYDPSLNVKSIKMGFIRKVYGILAAQLLYTAFLSCAISYSSPIANAAIFCMNHQFLMLIPTIAIICALAAYKDQYPMNLYLLWAFTTLMALPVGGICFLMSAAGDGDLVYSAIGVTAFIFFALSAYVWYSDDDFSWLNGFLYTLLAANLMLCMVGWISGWPFLHLMYNIFGVAIFSGYILYDTNMIVNKLQLRDCDMGTAI